MILVLHLRITAHTTPTRSSPPPTQPTSHTHTHMIALLKITFYEKLYLFGAHSHWKCTKKIKQVFEILYYNIMGVFVWFDIRINIFFPTAFHRLQGKLNGVLKDETHNTTTLLMATYAFLLILRKSRLWPNIKHSL